MDYSQDEEGKTGKPFIDDPCINYHFYETSPNFIKIQRNFKVFWERWKTTYAEEKMVRFLPPWKNTRRIQNSERRLRKNLLKRIIKKLTCAKAGTAAYLKSLKIL